MYGSCEVDSIWGALIGSSRHRDIFMFRAQKFYVHYKNRRKGFMNLGEVLLSEIM
jgi:hypothetical protein